MTSARNQPRRRRTGAPRIGAGAIRGDAGSVFFDTAAGSLASIPLTPAGEGLALGPPTGIVTMADGRRRIHGVFP